MFCFRVTNKEDGFSIGSPGGVVHADAPMRGQTMIHVTEINWISHRKIEDLVMKNKLL